MFLEVVGLQFKRFLRRHRAQGKSLRTASIVVVCCIVAAGCYIPKGFASFFEGARSRQLSRSLSRKAGMGQGLVTTQFFLHGRSHFTRTGWEDHSAKYPVPDPLQSVNLSGKTYIVTGANAGIGSEITSFLVQKGARVYMVCRNEERTAQARDTIIGSTGVSPDALVVLVADMSLQADVRRVAEVIASRETAGIDGLVCNAGALLNSLTHTSEGTEITFATHFLFGSYLLTKLLLPTLRSAARNRREPRVVFVSSGGMYNVPFPEWNVATCTPDVDGTKPEYNGQLAYAYAKRAQVLLAEHWAKLESSSEYPVTFVSAHPGWTRTKGVEEAYGEQMSWLEPLRDLWQGAEGICWLCISRAAEIEAGAFYLDRQPQVKHIAGAFFTEGSFTQNTEEEVTSMIAHCEVATGGKPEEML